MARRGEVLASARERGRDVEREAGDALREHERGDVLRGGERRRTEGGAIFPGAERDGAARRILPLCLAEGPRRDGHVLARGGERAVAARVGEIARHVEAHGAGG
jgi:hypothetical protein